MRVRAPNLPYYVDEIKKRVPELKLESVENMSQVEADMRDGTFDAIILPAESGSVLTLLYPKFTVVVPEPGIVKIALAYPLARRDQNWAHFINTWIELKQRNGTIDALYGHWILGNQAGKHQHRWSIVRNVLYWVE